MIAALSERGYSSIARPYFPDRILSYSAAVSFS